MERRTLQDFCDFRFTRRVIWQLNLFFKTLISYIKNNAKVGASQIRDIDIMENFAFVNVDNSIHRQVLEKCTGGKINKRRVNVEVSTNNKKKSRNRNRKSKNN